jgi:hypothetical protein
MSAFISVLDVHADIMDILWIIFVLPAPFCYLAFFITQSACTFSKKSLEITKNFLVKRSLKCGLLFPGAELLTVESFGFVNYLVYLFPSIPDSGHPVFLSSIGKCPV